MEDILNRKTFNLHMVPRAKGCLLTIYFLVQWFSLQLAGGRVTDNNGGLIGRGG